MVTAISVLIDIFLLTNQKRVERLTVTSTIILFLVTTVVKVLIFVSALLVSMAYLGHKYFFYLATKGSNANTRPRHKKEPKEVPLGSGKLLEELQVFWTFVYFRLRNTGWLYAPERELSVSLLKRILRPRIERFLLRAAKAFVRSVLAARAFLGPEMFWLLFRTLVLLLLVLVALLANWLSFKTTCLLVKLFL